MTMTQHSTPRSLELRLLRCSLSPPPPTTTTATPSPPPQPPISLSRHRLAAEEAVSLIEKGNYIGALSSDAAHILLELAPSCDFQDSIDCAQGFYLHLQTRVESLLQQDGLECGILLSSIAVAALLAFVQNNITGPYEDLPSFPFPGLQGKSVGNEWDMWARNHLMSTGSDLSAKFSLLQYIVYAKMLLTMIKDILWEEKVNSGVLSVSWWLSRLLLLQQRILADHTSSLFDSLQVLKNEMVTQFGKLERVESYWGTLLHEGEASSIVSLAHLEAGMIDYTYGWIDQARKYFDTAEKASGLQLSVTGVLGLRTLHQVDAKSQRVLVANTILQRSPELQANASKLGEDSMGPHSHEIQEASDILMTPKLLDDNKNDELGIQNGRIPHLQLVAIQQAVILAQCLIIEKNTPHGEMQGWDMAPFIEAVDAQEYSYYIVQCFCDILRVRWESTRSHTKERSLLMMEKKVQTVYDSSPGAAQRISYSFGVYLPTIPALRKEYGELLVRCGLIGDALKVFEDLELWDNLIDCYSLLEKKAAAVDLIKARLAEMPNNPRLWCSLGDVTNTDACYEKALEVSNSKSARAKRSLARTAYNRGDYEASKILWESALAMNSLFPDGWFAFGAAALKARDIEKALDGFTHAVQLDPDNGEAWNNIACLHMMKNKNKEAFIAFKEALKYRRNNWQCWENYSQVAVNIGNFGQALEAIKMVLSMTNNKRVDTDLLRRILVEIETRLTRPSSKDYAGEPNNEDHNSTPSHETEHLVEFLGNVLKQCVRSGVGEDIWGLYARWHKIKGDLTMCSEALLKQVRSYQGSDLWSNHDRYKKFASASLELCEVYMEISLRSGSRRELSSAELHLRNTIKQAAANFSETEETKALQSCLEEVRRRNQAT